MTNCTRKRCPNGFRKNKTGDCTKKNDTNKMVGKNHNKMASGLYIPVVTYKMLDGLCPSALVGDICYFRKEAEAEIIRILVLNDFIIMSDEEADLYEGNEEFIQYLINCLNTGKEELEIMCRKRGDGYYKKRWEYTTPKSILIDKN